jgi:uridine kinase
VDERGRTVEMSMKQYFDTIRPMHELYVEPSKHFSDLLIPQGGHKKGIQAIIDTIEQRIK